MSCAEIVEKEQLSGFNKSTGKLYLSLIHATHTEGLYVAEAWPEFRIKPATTSSNLVAFTGKLGASKRACTGERTIPDVRHNRE